MDDNQRAYMMRGKKVEDILKEPDYEDLIEAVVNVDGYHEQIAAKRAEINANDAKATADTTGTTIAKNLESAELVETGMLLSIYMQNHALDTNDEELKALIDYQRSELQKMDDNKKLQAAQALVDIAEANDDEIITALHARTPRPYSPAEFAAHKTNVAEFGALIGKPNAKRAVKTAHTKAVARGITELNAILATVRTRMGLLQFFEPIIYDAYVAADKIDDAPTHSNDHYEGNIDPNGQTEVTSITYDAEEELRIQNTGPTLIQLTFRNAGEVVGDVLEVPSGSTLERTFASIAPEGTAIWLQNMSADIMASFVLDII